MCRREEASDGTAEEEADDRVNINTADKEALMTLPGIGESKAETIIQYREEHGSFDSIEKLMEIPGIKEGVYNKVKDQIKV
jgi:competence protein ComEA